MFNKFLFSLAKQFLIHRKWQTRLIILTFTIGISTNLFIGNLIGSIEADLIDRTIALDGQITIKDRNGGYLNNYREIFPVLDEFSEIKTYCKIISGHAFLVEEANNTRDMMVRGYSDFTDSISDYRLFNANFKGKVPEVANEIVIGSIMAETLNLTIGSKLNLTSHPFIPLFRILYVSGIYQTGHVGLDDNWIMGQFLTAGIVLNAVDRISSISIQLSDPMISTQITEELQAKLQRTDLVIKDWQVENSALIDTIKAQAISTLLVQAFILLAISIALGSLLYVMVTNDQAEYAILQVLGIPYKDKVKLILYQALIIGGSGTILGLFFGLSFIGIFNLVGTENIVKIAIRPVYTTVSILIAILASLIAAAFPALKASNTTLITLIRRN